MIEVLQNMNEKKRWPLAALVVVLALCLAALLWHDSYVSRNWENKTESKEDRIRPLFVRKEKLSQELQELERQYSNATKGRGTLSILFTDINEHIYTEIFPVMQKSHIPGVLSISEKSFPGLPECLTADQIKEMQQSGWDVCVTWTAGDTVKDVKSVKKRAEEQGISFSQTVYFENGVYTKKYDKDLAGAGFRSVVHHCEEDLPMITSDISGELWYPGVVGLRGHQPKYRLQEAIANKKNLIYTVGFAKDDEMYASGPMTNMLNYVLDYVNKNSLEVMSPDEAREYYYSLGGGKEELTAEYEAEKAELESRIAELDKQIASIQAE